MGVPFDYKGRAFRSKSSEWGDTSYTLVKLHLQTPTNPETKIMYDLLALEKLNDFTIMEKYIEPVKDEFIKLFNETAKESVFY
jgi:hypothetical protein